MKSQGKAKLEEDILQTVVVSCQIPASENTATRLAL